MSYKAIGLTKYKNTVVGSGQCVAFVKVCAKAPATSFWKGGVKVKGNSIGKGTAIATFVDGKYLNNSSGNHAAILIEETDIGLQVWDQWIGQPVHIRTIRFKGGGGSPSNDGDAFSVIE